MGGADPANATIRVVQALDNISAEILVRVVIGPANEKFSDILELTKNKDNYEVYQSVTDMSSLLSWADIAISAAGTSLWEFAYSGLPVITTYVAENQISLAKAIGDFDCGINLGDVAAVSAETISETLSVVMNDQEQFHQMSKNMLSRVDGEGVVRLVKKIMKTLMDHMI